MNELTKANIDQARKVVCFASIVLMLSGLMFSRLLLSCGLIAFSATCLIHQDLKRQFKIFLSSPFFWAMTLLFVLPLISGLWSDDAVKWSQILRIKLPLIILPLCFAGLNRFSNRDWEKVAAAFLVVTIIAVVWSMWLYFQDMHSINAAYLKAQTMWTPLGNDHVRFSLVVSVAILTTIVLLTDHSRPKAVVAALWLVALGFAIYLHVLAARTGLLCFYVGAILYTIWSIRKLANKSRHAWMLLLVLLFPIVSWFAFPTFKNRLAYLKYDLSSVKNDPYRSSSNDGNRIASIHAGWELQNQHPVTGVGFGDIKAETDKWYLANYPQMTVTDRILPSSEWVVYGAGAGWPGFLLFSMVMVLPFFVRGLRKNIYWLLLNIFTALSYLFDIGVEVQFGVFVHAFILLWWYKWLSGQKFYEAQAVQKVQ